MKRLISTILAVAMLISFVPASVSAEETKETIKYNFLSFGVNGTSTTVTSANLKTQAVYENTSKYSAPWEYVNSISANNLTAYNYEFCYNQLGTNS